MCTFNPHRIEFKCSRKWNTSTAGSVQSTMTWAVASSSCSRNIAALIRTITRRRSWRSYESVELPLRTWRIVFNRTSSSKVKPRSIGDPRVLERGLYIDVHVEWWSWEYRPRYCWFHPIECWCCHYRRVVENPCKWDGVCRPPVCEFCEDPDFVPEVRPSKRPPRPRPSPRPSKKATNCHHHHHQDYTHNHQGYTHHHQDYTHHPASQPSTSVSPELSSTSAHRKRFRSGLCLPGDG